MINEKIKKLESLTEQKTKLLKELDRSMGLQSVFGKKIWSKGSIFTGATRKRCHANFNDQWTITFRQSDEIIYKGTLSQILKEKPKLHEWVLEHYSPVSKAFKKLRPSQQNSIRKGSRK
tara:strand:+ start:731 stop:1087 length:357 start_codon:yes stop_codon:yes gene_type:complete